MKLRDRINNVVDNFDVAATETISSSSLIKNAISNNIINLTENPRLKKIQTYDYIRFGDNDDMPSILATLLDKSTTHSGIVRKKANMISGIGIDSDLDDKKWKAFIENAGGFNVSLYELINKAAFNYTADGGFLIVVDTDTDTGQPIKLEIRSHKTFRLGAPNNGVVENFILRDIFKRVSGTVFSNDEEQLPNFDPAAKQSRYGLYVKNPFSTNPFYGTPNYISAFDFIEGDFEFGRTIKNSARNGFAPRVLATFIGRNMNDEQKREEAEKFKTNFNGADSENVIISFVRRAEEKPEFDMLNIQNLDKTIDVMAKLNDSKILTAHAVTNPALFGIAIAGKLGGTGTEMLSSYELFKAMETIPSRKIVMGGFETVLKNSAFKDIEIEIVDADMSFLINGGETTETEAETTEEAE